MAIYSDFSHEKWWFSIAMLVHQRLSPVRKSPLLRRGETPAIHDWHRCPHCRQDTVLADAVPWRSIRYGKRWETLVENTRKPLENFANVCEHPPITHRIYGIYANMTGVYWWQMLPYMAYMDPMGYNLRFSLLGKSIELNGVFSSWPCFIAGEYGFNVITQ
jgi:hypothetical protein